MVARAASRAIFVARGRYIKLSCVDPHLLYLEAGADHLAGDRSLVHLFDSLRHGCERCAGAAGDARGCYGGTERARLFLVAACFSLRLVLVSTAQW